MGRGKDRWVVLGARKWEGVKEGMGSEEEKKKKHCRLALTSQERLFTNFLLISNNTFPFFVFSFPTFSLPFLTSFHSLHFLSFYHIFFLFFLIIPSSFHTFFYPPHFFLPHSLLSSLFSLFLYTIFFLLSLFFLLSVFLSSLLVSSHHF